MKALKLRLRLFVGILLALGPATVKAATPTPGTLCESWHRVVLDIPYQLNGHTLFTYEGGKYFLSDPWRMGEFAYDSLPILVSEDLETWQEAVLPADLGYPFVVSDLAWNGEIYVAVITDRVIFTSPDGLSWTSHPAPAGAPRRIVWTGQVFVAFGVQGGVSTSPDGIDWTWISTIPMQYEISDVAWSGGTWVVQGYFERFVSDDLINWERFAEDGATQWAEWGDERFVLRRQFQGNASGVSSDGRNMEAIVTGFDYDQWGYTETPTYFVGGGFAFVANKSIGNQPLAEKLRLYTSKDGAEWRYEEFFYEEREVTDPSYMAVSHLVWDGSRVLFMAILGPAIDVMENQIVYLWIGDCPALAGGGDLPGMAHNDGFGGSAWRSDVWLTSQAPGEDEIVVSYLPWGAEAASLRQRSIRVCGGCPYELSDVVGGLFGEEGAGTVSLRPRSAGLAVAARTWDEGTHAGQGIPLFSWEDGIAAGEKAILSGLRDDEAARSNIGLVNLSDMHITVHMDFRDAAGERIALRKVQLQAHESTQLNRVLSAAAGADVAAASATVWTTTAGGRFVAYVSRIDNVSQDPVFITPSTRIPPLPGGQ